MNYIASYISAFGHMRTQPIFRLLRQNSPKTKSGLQNARRPSPKSSSTPLHPPVLVPPTPATYIFSNGAQVIYGMCTGTTGWIWEEGESNILLKQEVYRVWKDVFRKRKVVQGGSKIDAIYYMLYYTTWLISKMDPPIKYIVEKPSSWGESPNGKHCCQSEYDILHVMFPEKLLKEAPLQIIWRRG